MSKSRYLLLLLTFVLAAGIVSANDGIRQVQEELRKRNLYFGDINGRNSKELTRAVRKYQERKGFPTTGKIDQMTATSLNAQVAALSATEASWPEEPVLRSDKARQLTNSQRAALEASASLEMDAMPTPPPPAESPAPAQNIPPERIQNMVEEFLRTAETDDVEAQVRYFTFPVDYFVHGPVERDFVARDTANYVKRWPQRQYTLTEPVRFVAAANDTETVVQFPIEFNLSSPSRKAKARGRTMNYWTIRPEGDELKILSISEERLRE